MQAPAQRLPLFTMLHCRRRRLRRRRSVASLRFNRAAVAVAVAVAIVVTFVVLVAVVGIVFVFVSGPVLDYAFVLVPLLVFGLSSSSCPFSPYCTVCV